ncbi:MAG TPA: cation-transporting P-type ATPase [Candidatus Moranbacteria bacterium]|nr:cation-transporting P-type ATPase [Candidatus Moranbacteria bacterium]HRZ33757.1 cation-transporting P-type ATPase [Candidatus Moranbacteria bacterium]
MEKQIYNLNADEILEKFSATKKGLSSQEANLRLKKNGPNMVRKKQAWSWFSLLFRQFNDALVWILLVAAFLALLFEEYRDTTIILLIVFINAIIGFFQEFRAEKTLENIRKLTTDKAIVMRDGKKIEIDSRFLVAGDVICLSSGDTVPADAYLLEGYDLYANEFIFTGESKPKKKQISSISGENLSVADISNMIFMGSTLTRGEAVAVVSQTGMDTALGKIAHLVSNVKEDETPLQKQMRVLGRDVTILAVSVGILVLIAGYYYEKSWYDNFLFALALAVSVVPEGLPAAVSVTLSLGMKKLLKHNVLAKKLNAVETLASVNIICTDKTGTITRNELMVTNIIAGGEDEFIVDGQGYEPKGNFYQFGRIVDHKKIPVLEKIMRIASLCNSSELIKDGEKFEITGDPTEGALIVAARKYNENFQKILKDEKKINEIPFSSEKMRMSVVYKNEKNESISSYVKGSPDVLLDLCNQIQINGNVIPLSDGEKQKVRDSYNLMSKQALRVLAFAERNMNNVAENNFTNEADKNLTWIGMMGMIDPPRLDVHKAIEDCINSGIKVIMITGDYELTAEAIARKIGLLKSKNSEIINGKTLNQMTDEELFEKISQKEVVFARIAPEQKLRIATILKNNDAVIAMTGDGVNDAPALKKADIGVAMGVIGTDVSKEASDMILLDDNFASIVRVVKEGRTIYQNLKKFVYYVFTSNVSEFFTVIIGVLLQIPPPIAAVQILAVDLGTDIFPSFSLGLEPSEPGVMKRKPFNIKEKIINKQGIWRLIKVGLIMAIGAVITFILSMKRGGWDFGDKVDANSVLYIRSTTAAYAVIAMTQMANLLQARSETLSVFKIGFFRNKFAIISILVSIGILLSFMYIPFCQKYLHMLPIAWQDWVAVIISVIVVFIFEEGRKAEIKD